MRAFIQENCIQKVEPALQRQAEQQTIIANLGRSALCGQPIPSLLEEVVSSVVALLKPDMCAILQDVGDGDLRLAASSNWPDDAHVETPETAVNGVTIPISTGRSAVWGVLSAHSLTEREFSMNDLEFLRALTTVLAQAIERDRIDQQLIRHARQQRAIAELSRAALKSVDEAILIAGRIIEENLGVERARFVPGDHAPGGIAVPVTSTNHCFGALVAEGRQERLLIGPDFEFMQSLAHILAEAMEREHAGREARLAQEERRKLELQLAQADRLTSLGRMAATIAHEFNNVLMGVSPFVEVIRRGKNIETSLDHIGRAVKRGKRVTEEILRFTRHSQPQRAPFELKAWIDNIILEARSVVPSSCHIDTAIDAPNLVIDGDPHQLQQIFTNLILNARDAMPQGGQLTLEVRREPAHAQFAFGFVEQPERFAHCIVRDTGCGMSAETLRHIYEPLFTTKKHGTGFGLAVAHQVVQLHGGAIFVESTVGVGTTFHIFLPLAEEVARPQHVPEAVAERGNAQRHVLLVEDDRSVATGLQSLLEMEGLRVDVAETGADAIDAMNHIKPDVVVLDVGLPDMEGMSVYETLAAGTPRLPVIFSTGHADRRRLDALLEQPNVGYLLKPYASSTLLKAIEEVLV